MIEQPLSEGVTAPRPLGPIRRPSSWNAATLAAAPERWRLSLSDAECRELERAARGALDRALPLGALRPNDVPLPTLGPRLDALRRELVDGVGFAVLSGLSLDGHGAPMRAALFCAVGAHLGRTRSQNAAGDLLGHVRDSGADARDPSTRIYQTAERQTFHTDSADVVGLLCLRAAKAGGDSLVVSAETIHNRLLETAPELLPALFEPIATDRRGEVPPGAKPWFEIPVLSWHAGRLSVMYQRQYIESAARFAEAPRPSARQLAALDAFDRAANDPSLHVAMRLAPGEMQFVHNHSLLHDRTAFTDHEAPERRRHLYRLWLAVEGDRELPGCFAERYGSIAIGDRGGIRTAATTLRVPPPE